MDAGAPEVGEQLAVERRRRWPWVVGGVAIALVFGVAGMFAWAQFDESRPIPEFPRLADRPDPSLHGTVAYTSADGCVRIVAASGARSKDVYCLPPEDLSKAPKTGKEVGPQLVWLPDGRLEITMFRMDIANQTDTKKAPPLTGAWQKLVDVRTGKVTDVPAAEVPTKLDTTTRPTVDPDGRKLVVNSDPSTGKVKVVLEDGAGSRTLMSAHGPGKYTYGLDAAFWAPNWDWVAADDGRILVITTDETPTTRVLVADRGGRSGGAEGASFAVSTEDYLTS